MLACRQYSWDLKKWQSWAVNSCVFQFYDIARCQSCCHHLHCSFTVGRFLLWPTRSFASFLSFIWYGYFRYFSFLMGRESPLDSLVRKDVNSIISTTCKNLFLNNNLKNIAQCQCTMVCLVFFGKFSIVAVESSDFFKKKIGETCHCAVIQNCLWKMKSSMFKIQSSRVKQRRWWQHTWCKSDKAKRKRVLENQSIGNSIVGGKVGLGTLVQVYNSIVTNLNELWTCMTTTKFNLSSTEEKWEFLLCKHSCHFDLFWITKSNKIILWFLSSFTIFFSCAHAFTNFHFISPTSRSITCLPWSHVLSLSQPALCYSSLKCLGRRLWCF